MKKSDIEKIESSLEEVTQTLYGIYYSDVHLSPEQYAKIGRAFHLVQGIDLTELKEMFDTED